MDKLEMIQRLFTKRTNILLEHYLDDDYYASSSIDADDVYDLASTLDTIKSILEA